MNGPGLGAGLAAVAELRGRVFLRRLRGKGGAAEGIALLLLFLLAIPGSLVFAAMVGAGSFRAARTGHGAQVSISLAAIFFGVWQTWTAVSLSLSDRDALDLRRFLAFPIPPGRVYALGLATSVLGDPFAVFWLVVLGGAFTGAAFARPGAWLGAYALLLLLFSIATVALAALLQEIGSRVARSRHVRAYTLLAAIAGWSLLLAAAAGWVRAPGAALRALGHVRWVALPAALASSGATSLYAGDVAGALPWFALLAAAAAAFGWGAYRVALATALLGGEGGAVGRRAAERPGLLARAGPLLEKELRFLARHPVLRLYALLLPVLTGVVAWRVAARPPSAMAELAGALPLLGVAAYVHLVTQPFWLNAFGWDRGGARLLFLAPLDLAEVLRAKNQAALAASTTLFALCALSAVAAGEPPPPWAIAGAAALHLGMAPALHALGNVVSIWNPRAAAFGAQRAGHVSPLSSLAGLAIVSGVAGLFALPVLLAVSLEQPWLLAWGWAALGGCSLVVYRASLPRAAALLARRREQLLAVVAGETE